MSAAAAAQASAPAHPFPTGSRSSASSCQYSDSNLDFVKAEGFTSMELRLDPDQLDDAAIAVIKNKSRRAGSTFHPSPCDGNHIDPDPAKRE